MEKSKVKPLLSCFAEKLLVNKEDSLQVNQMVKTLVFEINILNSLNNFIDTEESEIIIEYILFYWRIMVLQML